MPMLLCTQRIGASRLAACATSSPCAGEHCGSAGRCQAVVRATPTSSHGGHGTRPVHLPCVQQSNVARRRTSRALLRNGTESPPLIVCGDLMLDSFRSTQKASQHKFLRATKVCCRPLRVVRVPKAMTAMSRCVDGPLAPLATTPFGDAIFSDNSHHRHQTVCTCPWLHHAVHVTNSCMNHEPHMALPPTPTVPTEWASPALPSCAPPCHLSPPSLDALPSCASTLPDLQAQGDESTLSAVEGQPGGGRV